MVSPCLGGICPEQSRILVGAASGDRRTRFRVRRRAAVRLYCPVLDLFQPSAGRRVTTHELRIIVERIGKSRHQAVSRLRIGAVV